ncbi:MAG: hypothetical protein ACREDK_02350 [Thermoplasmata archaeon]
MSILTRSKGPTDGGPTRSAAAGAAVAWPYVPSSGEIDDVEHLYADIYDWRSRLYAVVRRRLLATMVVNVAVIMALGLNGLYQIWFPPSYATPYDPAVRDVLTALFLTAFLVVGPLGLPWRLRKELRGMFGVDGTGAGRPVPQRPRLEDLLRDVERMPTVLRRLDDLRVAAVLLVTVGGVALTGLVVGLAFAASGLFASPPGFPLVLEIEWGGASLVAVGAIAAALLTTRYFHRRDAAFVASSQEIQRRLALLQYGFWQKFGDRPNP